MKAVRAFKSIRNVLKCVPCKAAKAKIKSFKIPKPNITLKPQHDADDRDPKVYCEILQIAFDDVFGEPPETQNITLTWLLSRCCFETSKNCFYLIFSAVFTPMVIAVGNYIATVIFASIWCFIPCVKCCSIRYRASEKCTKTCVHGIIIPCARGMCCCAIRLNTQDLGQNKEIVV